jgi:hypothetical protein
MANTFKVFTNNDITTTKTPLHESIPLTGTIVSGTYGDNNIKNYSHELFQSVYDYPFLSSSANRIFDITFGLSAKSNVSASTVTANAKKIRMYNSMAKVLVGHDTTGSILEFDRDGDLTTTGDKLREVFIIPYSRLLTKDEVKKGSFRLEFITGGVEAAPAASDGIYTIGDYGAATEYRVNSPAGEYGILYSASTPINAGSGVGLIYYQAGVVVVTASVFDGEFGGPSQTFGTSSIRAAMSGATIQQMADGLRNRWYDCDFNNTVELNSSIYFCRANHNDFNYSSNPTYLSASKILVKNSSKDSPLAYITGVGLYSSDGELLATAKLSEPLKKDPSTELTIRLRLDF